MTSYIKIILLLALCQLACQHHVVFEEIGEMAGALSYIHAVVPVTSQGWHTPLATLKPTFAPWRLFTKRRGNTLAWAPTISFTSKY